MLAANAKLADTSCVSAKYASASNCFHPLTSSDSGRALLVGVSGSCCIAVTSWCWQPINPKTQLAPHVLADYYCVGHECRASYHGLVTKLAVHRIVRIGCYSSARTSR